MRRPDGAWEVEAPEAVLLWKSILRGSGLVPARVSRA